MSQDSDHIRLHENTGRMTSIEDALSNYKEPGEDLIQTLRKVEKTIEVIDTMPQENQYHLRDYRDQLTKILSFCKLTWVSSVRTCPEIVTDYILNLNKGLVAFWIERLGSIFDPVNKVVYTYQEYFPVAKVLFDVTEFINTASPDISMKSLEEFEEVGTTLTYAKLWSTYIDLMSEGLIEDATMLELMYRKMLRPEVLQLLTFEDMNDEDSTLKCWDTITQQYMTLELDIFTYRKLTKLRIFIDKNKDLHEPTPRPLYGKDANGTFMFSYNAEEMWKKLTTGFNGLTDFSYTPIDLIVLQLEKQAEEDNN